jgi:hypothetical protein
MKIGVSLYDSIGNSDDYSDLYYVLACYRKTIGQIFLKLHSQVSPDGTHMCIFFGDNDIDGDSDIAASNLLTNAPDLSNLGAQPSEIFYGCRGSCTNYFAAIKT